MPTFTYVARKRDGKKDKGSITADSRQAAMTMLRAKGLQAETIKEKASGKTKRMGRAKVKSAELLVFTRQLSTIVDAGMPLLQGLDILSEQTDDENFAQVLIQVAAEVEAGETFSEALKRFPKAFPDLYVSMIRAGEAGGNLDGVLMQLADYMEATEELKRRIKSAMMYPVVAFSMVLLIAGGLIMFVVPQFAEIFASFGGTLPAPTRILIGMSEIIRGPKMAIVVAACIAAIVGIRMYGSTPLGRYNIDAIKLRMPVFGKILRKVAVSRFSRTLSTLTHSGVAILQALEIVERTAGNEVFAKAIREAGDCVRGGETLGEPLARCGEFPPIVTRMIAIGEKTGALEQMLSKIADFYDSEVKAAVDGMTSLIEPLLIMLMGLVVGGIVIALFMPILMLSTLVGN